MRPKYLASRQSGIRISSWQQSRIVQKWCVLQTLLMASELLEGSLCQEPPQCNTTDTPVVRRLEDIPQDSYGRSGLAHVTIAGAVHHGMQEVEVWMQTFAPDAGTPIHRHDCEEVFVVLQGGGTLYTAGVPSADFEGTPGSPLGTPILSNSTFTIPRNQVHRVWNTGEEANLQLLVVVSRPPIHVYAYQSWDTPHEAARHLFPYPWDAVCPQEIQSSRPRQEKDGEQPGAREEL